MGEIKRCVQSVSQWFEKNGNKYYCFEFIITNVEMWLYYVGFLERGECDRILHNSRYSVLVHRHCGLVSFCSNRQNGLSLICSIPSNRHSLLFDWPFIPCINLTAILKHYLKPSSVHTTRKMFNRNCRSKPLKRNAMMMSKFVPEIRKSYVFCIPRQSTHVLQHKK